MQLRLLSGVVRYELHYNTMNLTSYTSIIHEYYYYVMRLVLCNHCYNLHDTHNVTFDCGIQTLLWRGAVGLHYNVRYSYE